MLSQIVTKNQQKILAALWEGNISLSGLARKTFLTKARVFSSLKELEQEDLVRKKAEGRTHLYRLNILNGKIEERLKGILREKSTAFNQKLGGLPGIIDAFLKTVLKEKYGGCIFFGSSLTENNFQDIDLLIIASKTDKMMVLIKRLKQIDARLSPITATEGELKKGISAEDMLYKNIIQGLPFSGIDSYLRMKFLSSFLKKEDVRERFIIGLREIISCQEFPEREYAKKHLEKGILDMVYAYLNYFDFSPRNDGEARKIFKQKTKLPFPLRAEKAKLLAKRLGMEML